jgi:hypothetical protein
MYLSYTSIATPSMRISNVKETVDARCPTVQWKLNLYRLRERLNGIGRLQAQIYVGTLQTLTGTRWHYVQP